MYPVKPKKGLGQHFLADKNIARKITGALSGRGYDHVLEIGPGTGVLTGFLLENKSFETHLVEIDRESAAYLKKRFPGISGKIHEGDFLKFPLAGNFSSPLAIIGNFPYNISSQIFFRILENRQVVAEVVCMVQREVAERITSPPGSKTYGILSVLLQAFYRAEFLFSVPPQVFVPPPRVNSAVIRLTRRPEAGLNCNEELFFKVVKRAFNQRRKMLRNSLASFLAGRADRFRGEEPSGEGAAEERTAGEEITAGEERVAGELATKERMAAEGAADERTVENGETGGREDAGGAGTGEKRAGADEKGRAGTGEKRAGADEKGRAEAKTVENGSAGSRGEIGRLLAMRPEQLSTKDFVNLTNFIDSNTI